MTKAAKAVAAAQNVSVEQATSPLRPPPNKLGAEQNKLDAVISEAVSQAQVASLLGDKELFRRSAIPSFSRTSRSCSQTLLVIRSQGVTTAWRYPTGYTT
jgi:hypothetical protein